MGAAKGLEVLGAGVNAARALGAGTSALLEATTVAQETYDNALSKTGNQGVAMDQAYKALVVSLPVTFLLDKAAYFAEGAGAIRNMAVAAGSEATQEGSQQVTSNVLGYQPAGAGVTEAAAIGGIAGGSVKGVVTVADYINQATPEQRSAIENAINNIPTQTKLQLMQDVNNTTQNVKQGVYETLTSDPAVAQKMRDMGIITAADDKFNDFMKTITGGLGTKLEFMPSGPSFSDVATPPVVEPEVQPSVKPQPTVPATKPAVTCSPITSSRATSRICSSSTRISSSTRTKCR